MHFPQTSNAWLFAIFKNFIHSQLLKPIFCRRTVVKLTQTKLIKLQNRLFYGNVISPFAKKLFLLPFTSHWSTQNISFSGSGYVIKPPQPSSASWRVPTLRLWNYYILEWKTVLQHTFLKSDQSKKNRFSIKNPEYQI